MTGDNPSPVIQSILVTRHIIRHAEENRDTFICTYFSSLDLSNTEIREPLSFQREDEISEAPPSKQQADNVESLFSSWNAGYIYVRVCAC